MSFLISLEDYSREYTAKNLAVATSLESAKFFVSKELHFPPERLLDWQSEDKTDCLTLKVGEHSNYRIEPLKDIR